MGDEAFARRNRQQKGFGHFYELLYLNSERFDYVDDFLCAAAIVPLSGDADNPTMSNAGVLGSVYKYRVINDLASVIDTYDTAAEQRTLDALR